MSPLGPLSGLRKLASLPLVVGECHLFMDVVGVLCGDMDFDFDMAIVGD